MISEKMHALGTKRSCIRELFEYGIVKSAEIGHENVFDFSLGNPSVPAPKEIEDAIREILDTQTPVKIHSYTSASGDLEVRSTIAASINLRYNAGCAASNLYMTCGAAAALASTFKALTINHTSEFIAIAPFFPEYRCFVEGAGAAFKVVSPNIPSFQIDFDALERTISQNTQGVIINSPNNPSGVVYTRDTIQTLASLLERKAAQYGHDIYLISDEPYRELVYNGIEVPFVPYYYKNTIICYSYSKALSLPGERIGYAFVSPKANCSADIINGIAGAARATGYVCAPSMMQMVVAKCANIMPNLEVYKKNRDLLYSNLTAFGYECVQPDGAFYLFVKAPNGNSVDFSQKAKEHNLLIVPADDFGCPGYLRISYCVETAMLERSLQHFKAII